ncbi:MAG: hypothetical protein P3A30_04880 [Gemmatimonadota bacterium]|nr:hypothetical protein [Gemmatimonadota bacterium]
MIRSFALLVAVLLFTGCDSLLSTPLASGRIRVEARDRRGEPLPGITAQLYVGYRPMGYLKTNGRGVVLYENVPEGLYGVYMRLPEPYVGWDEVAGLPRRDLVDGIAVGGGTDTTLRFEFLRRGTGTTIVWTVDEDSRPVGGRTVALYRASGIVAESVSDSTGRVAFTDVPMGIYGVASTAPPEFGAPSRAYVFRDNLVMDGGHWEVVRLELPRCSGSLTPRVVDASNAPVPGASVTLYRGPQFFRTSMTDARGEVAWTRVDCGEYGVFVVPPAGYQSPYARDTAFVDGIRVTDLSSRTVTLRAFKIP